MINLTAVADAVADVHCSLRSQVFVIFLIFSIFSFFSFSCFVRVLISASFCLIILSNESILLSLCNIIAFFESNNSINIII